MGFHCSSSHIFILRLAPYRPMSRQGGSELGDGLPALAGVALVPWSSSNHARCRTVLSLWIVGFSGVRLPAPRLLADDRRRNTRGRLVRIFRDNLANFTGAWRQDIRAKRHCHTRCVEVAEALAANEPVRATDPVISNSLFPSRQGALCRPVGASQLLPRLAQRILGGRQRNTAELMKEFESPARGQFSPTIRQAPKMDGRGWAQQITTSIFECHLKASVRLILPMPALWRVSQFSVAATAALR